MAASFTRGRGLFLEANMQTPETEPEVLQVFALVRMIRLAADLSGSWELTPDLLAGACLQTQRDGAVEIVEFAFHLAGLALTADQEALIRELARGYFEHIAE
jgi:hypothetical protein